MKDVASGSDQAPECCPTSAFTPLICLCMQTQSLHRHVILSKSVHLGIRLKCKYNNPAAEDISNKLKPPSKGGCCFVMQAQQSYCLHCCLVIHCKQQICCKQGKAVSELEGNAHIIAAVAIMSVNMRWLS